MICYCVNLDRLIVRLHDNGLYFKPRAFSGAWSIYNRPEADFIARFPSFYNFFRSSFEHLYWHYLSWIEVDFDSTTNITTIYAYAFRPADAHTVARQLLVLGEHAVNRMNDRVNRVPSGS